MLIVLQFRQVQNDSEYVLNSQTLNQPFQQLIIYAVCVWFFLHEKLHLKSNPTLTAA